MTRLTMLVAAVLAAVVLTGSSAAAPPRLIGVVGPSFNITLLKNGQKVKTLKHGLYTLVIADRSKIHNFHLRGPVSTTTGVKFVGIKTVKITLKAGKYTYVCDPHAGVMKGSFTVT